MVLHAMLHVVLGVLLQVLYTDLRQEHKLVVIHWCYMWCYVFCNRYCTQNLDKDRHVVLHVMLHVVLHVLLHALYTDSKQGHGHVTLALHVVLCVLHFWNMLYIGARQRHTCHATCGVTCVMSVVTCTEHSRDKDTDMWCYVGVTCGVTGSRQGHRHVMFHVVSCAVRQIPYADSR